MSATVPKSDRMPCAVAQPYWLLRQALDNYTQSIANWKSVAARTRHRKQFFAFARQVIPVIGGQAFLDEFKSHCGSNDKEGPAVAAELIRELASGK